MIKKITLVFLLILLLPSCVKVAGETPTNTPIVFVTSTLPPTKIGLRVATDIPPTASPTLDPLAPTPTPSCHDSALFVEDVTYPDNTHLEAGEKFTKTWKFQNTGNCKWTGYTVAFVSGDRMEAPSTVAVPETESQGKVEVSVDLVAPAEDGAYTGNFELLDANGRSVLLGSESTFWVKIIVGEDVTPAEQIAGNCTYTENPEYEQTLIDLINKARAEAGRPALTFNPKLAEAARAHSLDMACNQSDRLIHSGSDGSWTGDRLERVGYTGSYYLEILAIGLPGDAMNQWKDEKNDWSAVLNSRVTEIGAAYVYSKFSAYGSYWTVVMGEE